MLKVAFICDDLMVGGWTSITDMILNFGTAGVEPFVVCLFGKGHYAEILEKAGIKVHLLDLKKSNAPLKFLELVSIFKKEKPDIVHTNLHYSDFFGGAAAIAAGVKHRVAQIHSIKEKYKHPLTWPKRKILSSASVVVAVSGATREAFNNEYPGLSVEVRTIPNGINLCEFRRRLGNASLTRRDIGVPEDSMMILTVANFKWQKGYEHLVDAVEMLGDPSVRFVIAGYGQEKSKTEKMIAEKGLQDRIILLGMRTDVPDLMKISDLFLLPSVVEPFGICILEAFVSGVPVIASSVDGIKETATDMENALLVPPANPAEICSAIRKLQNDIAMRDKIRQGALKRVEDFDIGIISSRFKDLYCEIRFKSDKV